MRHTHRPTFLYHNHNRRGRLHTLCHCPPTLRVDQFLPAPRAFSYNTNLRRLRQLIPRISVLLLGSCALTGNPFAVDRHVLARELRFQSHRKQSVRCGQCSEEPSHTYQMILFGWVFTARSVLPSRLASKDATCADAAYDGARCCRSHGRSIWWDGLADA